ncbi:MAG: primosomal protein N' [Clostridia bacterium]|nr:primosomal protein N' [Clostridia bacterium]
MIAEVIIESTAKQLNRTFDYNIPKEIEEYISVGSAVLVPFGRKKELEEAYVVGIKDTTEYEVKDIAKLKNNLTEKQIRLAKWMSKKYFCNISECIKLMLAPGAKRKNEVQEKKVNVVYLKKEIEEIEKDIEQGEIKSEKQKRILQFLKYNEGSSAAEIEMFTDCSNAILKTLEKNGYVEFIEKKIERNPLISKDVEKTEKLELTEEQRQAYSKIEETIEQEENKEYLIYGVTGSGKTEVYLQLIEKTIEKGKIALMLVPEIALTPQTVDRFVGRFGKEKIAILHSKLSIGERYDEWNKIKDGKSNIIIGTRSAIFAPTDNIGIIIIDEEHDSSYKSESTPRYNAKEIASILGKQGKFPVVLGSATPEISTYYKSKTGKIELLTLTKRANKSELPQIEIVDLKQELANGNRSMLSVSLYQKIEANLKNKKQTILFLNRRGYSTFIMCRDCGYTVKCKNCNISMTYHKKENKLKCHYCGAEQKVMTTCPSCKSTRIRYFGTGTQKLEQEINKIFSNAQTIRMDVDTVTKKNSHEDILNHFKNDNIDILIGTQMVVKGHHFPNVTLVGVIAADSSLNIDDYRANERTFQILTQVAGRAGREGAEGKVVLQTYNPENFCIELAKRQDYDEFYKTEIALRKQLKYPPFCDIIIINFNSKKEIELQKATKFVYEYLNTKLDKQHYAVYQPMPSPIDKIQNKIRWRMIVKGNMKKETYEIINECLKEVYKLNLRNTGINADVNPNNMM